jgi:competence protein ComEA
VSTDERRPAADPLGRVRGWELGPGAVRALAVVAVVVALAAAVLAWRARPRVDPVTAAVPTGAVTDVAGASVSPTGVVVVAVSGHVRQPGLVRLPAGARVADAVEAAGGALPGTDLGLLNLARRVTDGELILVGITPQPGSVADPGGGAGGAAGTVNLNTATSAQLQTLPGVGPVLADRIIAYRAEHGPFASVADLRKVTGIGDARYNELKDRVSV